MSKDVFQQCDELEELVANLREAKTRYQNLAGEFLARAEKAERDVKALEKERDAMKAQLAQERKNARVDVNP